MEKAISRKKNKLGKQTVKTDLLIKSRTMASTIQENTKTKVGKVDESLISSEERLKMIAEAAYYRAEERGFDGENIENDWLETEKIIDERLAKAAKTTVESLM